jgi:hypothetical protein
MVEHGYTTRTLEEVAEFLGGYVTVGGSLDHGDDFITWRRGRLLKLEEIAEKLVEWIGTTVNAPDVNMVDLNEAAYTLNEGRFWLDDLELSPEVIIQCWRLVEKLSTVDKLPDEFKL